MGLWQQDSALFDMRIKHVSDTVQQNQPSEDQNPVVIISPVETSSQLFADVDEKQDDLDAPDGSLQEHVSAGCNTPKKCSLCGGEDHLYRNCSLRKRTFADLFFSDDLQGKGEEGSDTKLGKIASEAEGSQKSARIGKVDEKMQSMS
ncbi:hypothetical protein PHYPO_G00248080 [Pangasianodon hypophthalmus]|uniref:Uncharacterized protein n=1 Tax=Pangasianodon hypophthalmus TaxID=310915 RepID=A0A5N5NEE3_PANHP|nr:hypothetical protein PHYPO_G00248080 [Pangasianodon hypophthalmus]